MEIMTPDNPRWKEFMERLEGPEGCNFRESEENPGSITWDCNGTDERSLARSILEKMGGFDIEASMNYFKENGGSCDCEIFNVYAHCRRE